MLDRSRLKEAEINIQNASIVALFVEKLLIINWQWATDPKICLLFPTCLLL